MAKAKSKSNFVLIVLVLIIGVGFITYTNTDKRIEPNVLGGQRAIYSITDQGPCGAACVNNAGDDLGYLFWFCGTGGVPYEGGGCFGGSDGKGSLIQGSCVPMIWYCYDENYNPGDPECQCPDIWGAFSEDCYMGELIGFNDPPFPPPLPSGPAAILCEKVFCSCQTAVAY